MGNMGEGMVVSGTTKDLAKLMAEIKRLSNQEMVLRTRIGALLRLLNETIEEMARKN